MKESVRSTRHPWLVGLCVVAIAVVYFVLMARSRYPEPGPNLTYDLAALREVDRVETRFEETGRIALELADLRALAIGAEGTIYLAAKDTIAVLGADGVERTRFAIKGTPSSLAATPDGTVFVGIGDHIEVFDGTGVVQAVWPALGPRAYITSIAVGEEGVFAADAGNRVVHRFDRNGAVQGRIGEANLAKDIPGIVVPSPYFDVAFDDDGTLWVVNPGMMGLESYRSNGDLIASWYRPSVKLEGFAGCCNPSHIAFTSEGRLVTCEKGLVRVKVYDADSGEFEELVAGTEQFPAVQSPKDMAIDADDRILVLDAKENAVRIFEIKEELDEASNQSA